MAAEQTKTTSPNLIRKPKVGRPKKRTVGQPKNRYRRFNQARKYARRQKLNSAKEWYEFTRTTKRFPPDIPIHPDKSYPRQWTSWEDFLGCGFVSFEEAKAIVRPLQIPNVATWRERYNELFPTQKKVPLRPQLYYKDEWVSWSDFSGMKRTNPNRDKSTYRTDQLRSAQKKTYFRPYMEAVKFVSTLGLKDYKEWLKWRGTYKLKDLPWRPPEVYEEWQGWSIWLGHDPLPGLLAEVGVLFVGKHEDDPDNVYRMEVHKLGKSDLLHRATRDGFRVIRMWKYDPNLKEDIRKVSDMNRSSYYGSEQIFIIPNIFGLYGDLFTLLPVIV